MKKIITIMVLCAGIQMSASAQTFTQRIQKVAPGKGTITIHQSTDIDKLVNSAVLSTAKPAAPSTSAANNKPATSTDPKSNTSATSTDPKSNTPATHNPAATSSENPTTESSDLPVDNTKKILRGGYKITGYRVQAFAGGNSRKDRQQAEQVGNSIKASFPEEPIYVHFYSPRWICRVGNYRTYEEAHQMLISLRKLGFKQATIVKGKIIVTD